MSLWSESKDLVWYLRDRVRRPAVQVGFGARLGRDCRVGHGVVVGRGARVYHSQLGDMISIGAGTRLTACRLEGDSAIGDHGDLGSLELGRYSYIASSARAGRISFGRFCSVGPELLCGWGEHPTDRLSTSPLFYSTQKQCGTSFSERNLFQEWRAIRVGNDVWIGARVFIRDGVTIGNGAIVGAGAVVVKDVPPYAVVGGVPSRILRWRFSEEVVSNLQRLAWWDWEAVWLKRAQPYLSQSDPRALLAWAASQEFPHAA